MNAEIREVPGATPARESQLAGRRPAQAELPSLDHGGEPRADTRLSKCALGKKSLPPLKASRKRAE
jgi:hypothetical protein